MCDMVCLLDKLLSVDAQMDAKHTSSPALHILDAGGSIALLEDRLTESSSDADEDGNNVGEGEEHGRDDSGICRR